MDVDLHEPWDKDWRKAVREKWGGGGVLSLTI